MKKYLLAAVLSMAVTASVALAGDLITPAQYVGSGHNAICRLVNVSTSPISAQIQLAMG
jgi:hypothetical protein